MYQKVDHLKPNDLVAVGSYVSESTRYALQIGIFRKVTYDRIDKSEPIAIEFINIDSGSYSLKERINVRNSKNQRIFKITTDNLTANQYRLYEKVLLEQSEGIIMFNNGRYVKITFEIIKDKYIEGDYDFIANLLYRCNHEMNLRDAENIIINEIRAKHAHSSELITLLLSYAKYQDKIC